MIRNRTNWNHVLFYNEVPYWLHREDHSIYFCVIPAKDVQPESNHEEISNSTERHSTTPLVCELYKHFGK